MSQVEPISVKRLARKNKDLLNHSKLARRLFLKSRRRILEKVGSSVLGEHQHVIQQEERELERYLSLLNAIQALDFSETLDFQPGAEDQTPFMGLVLSSMKVLYDDSAGLIIVGLIGEDKSRAEESVAHLAKTILEAVVERAPRIPLAVVVPALDEVLELLEEIAMVAHLLHVNHDGAWLQVIRLLKQTHYKKIVAEKER